MVRGVESCQRQSGGSRRKVQHLAVVLDPIGLESSRSRLMVGVQRSPIVGVIVSDRGAVQVNVVVVVRTLGEVMVIQWPQHGQS